MNKHNACALVMVPCADWVVGLRDNALLLFLTRLRASV
jgi:hypothetical protein